MKKITVTLDDSDATALLGLVVDLNPITLEMVDVTSDSPSRPHPVVTHKRKKRRKSKIGLSGKGYEAVLDFIRHKPQGFAFRPKDVEITMLSVGLNVKSASPVLSRMKAAGLLEQTGIGSPYTVTALGKETATKAFPDPYYEKGVKGNG